MGRINFKIYTIIILLQGLLRVNFVHLCIKIVEGCAQTQRMLHQSMCYV